MFTAFKLTVFHKIPYSTLFSRDLNFAKSFSAHFASLEFRDGGEKIVFAGNLISQN